MGMDADVIGFGPFRKEIAKYLPYSEEAYDGVKNTSWVVVEFFRVNSTEHSMELAKAFGIDPWDFNKHRVSGLAVTDKTIDDLRRVGEHECWDDNEIEGFLKCLKLGFIFFYRPNG